MDSEAEKQLKNMQITSNKGIELYICYLEIYQNTSIQLCHKLLISLYFFYLLENENMEIIDWAKAIKRVRSGYLQELNFAEERPYDKSDFVKHVDYSYKCLQDTMEVIKAQSNLNASLLKENRDIFKNFTVSTLLLCGENVQSKEWNESRHIEIRYYLIIE